ncbi:MAG: elongation factor P hydroxylase [Pseudomonadales bacterium]|nr:elongation factor P hydroxylase [Pseudomonadales bacterium]MBO6565382.1 elongation factor P hydroxylase [Pseudomonadales bacterium]MBO6594690.1 elongation factor P hydroxylase [Pseudomonadales bacterium]MBO6821751.1 elongation factor P hydroxylase [Pseudomonadales bacterium]
MELSELSAVFERTVGQSNNTRLQGGAPEPLYEPAGDDRATSVIYFRNDYVSSALHEIAHWCIAGPARREKEDYGYWYEGERGETKQRAFESVEARPQALEWIMSNAAGVRFRVSCDNFDESTLDMSGFRRKVRAEVPAFLERLPTRAETFIGGLMAASGCYGALRCETYKELPG